MSHPPFLLGLDLAGKFVVLVGAGRVGARRVGDLVAAGALVTVISPRADPVIQGLAARGHVTWHPREYSGAADLEAAWLVHTATGVPEVDAQVARDAENARVFCVQAAAASQGSARVPARRAVPTPDGAIQLGVLSQDPRRSAEAARIAADAVTAGAVHLRSARASQDAAGSVALIGGGPGPPGLISVRGHQLLRCADVVVVDRLAPRSLLDDLPEKVHVIDVGKEVGFHAVPQEQITELLITHARAGRRVARLKGGDPYVFGRGGEEREACEAAGVAVEVVPGITSAISVPAAAGIPVTHRGVAAGFTVVTGHDQIGSVPTDSGHTLMLLMGVAKLADSATALMAAGRSPDCPAAIIERGMLPGQRTTVARLEDLADRARSVGVRSPAVVVIGEVVRLGPDWGSQHPSSGLSDASATFGPPR